MTEWSFEHPANFKLQGKIGEGAFGTVVKVIDETDNNKEYALKRIRNYASMPGHILAPYARKICREVETLSLLQGCDYIVPLNKIYLSADKKDVYMMMPYIQYDLQNVVESRVLKDEEIKWIAYQMLYGIAQVHARKLMHRDLTLKNILISDEFETYIADFGLARAHETCTEDITLDVVTLEYRAPELLLQHKKYDTRVDVWSVGCMIAELYLRRRLFVPQRRDIPCQLIKLIQVLGRPDIEFVRQHASPSATQFFQNLLNKFDAAAESQQNAYDPPISEQLKAAGASAGAIELVCSLLQFDFRKRLSAAQTLQLDWFKKDPEYSALAGVAEPISCSLSHFDHNTTDSASEFINKNNNNNDDSNNNNTELSESAKRLGSSQLADPSTPLDDGAVERLNNGDIEEANPSLRVLQSADIDGLRSYMETKADKIPNMIIAEYSTAPSVAETL